MPDFEATVHPTFGVRAARVLIGKNELGVLGEVHPAVRRAFDLPDQRVCIAELRLAPLVAAVSYRPAMQSISSFPAIKEDLAVVVDEAVLAEQVEQMIRQTGGSLLREVRLFDIYRGKQVAIGKKSLAYSLTFQADDKTLKDFRRREGAQSHHRPAGSDAERGTARVIKCEDFPKVLALQCDAPLCCGMRRSR